MADATSYTAASSLPLKLLHHDLSRPAPLHVQFIPTNRCNQRCSFCSCTNRRASDEMALDEVREMVAHLASNGCLAATVTGGGDPLMHPDIEGIIHAFVEAGIEVGLVTNGTLFDRLHPDIAALLTWCRISCSDERHMPEGLADYIAEADIDWSFSYVLTTKPDIENLARHIAFAEDCKFTHVRVVSDLLDVEHSAMEQARAAIGDGHELVIWQDRQEYTAGAKKCLISLIKPVIGADRMVYPCCGVQYAQEQMALDLPRDMSMGHWSQLGSMEPFDGSVCSRCYYENYNILLAGAYRDFAHLSFV